jgi:hypothetical protein
MLVKKFYVRVTLTKPGAPGPELRGDEFNQLLQPIETY